MNARTPSAQSALAAAQQAAVVANASGQVPYYQNETPTFSLPGSGTTALASI